MTEAEAREALHSFAGTDRWSNHDFALFDGQINNFAHALAKKIRSADGWLPDGEWSDSRDRDHAANLIDPEVENE